MERWWGNSREHFENELYLRKELWATFERGGSIGLIVSILFKRLETGSRIRGLVYVATKHRLKSKEGVPKEGSDEDFGSKT